MSRASNRQTDFYLWENQDGSPGGEVSTDADVDPTATIEQHAIVLAGAIIGPREVVPTGHIVDADGTMISFGKTECVPALAP